MLCYNSSAICRFCSHFTDEKGYTCLKNAGKIIEDRSYDMIGRTVRYFHCDADMHDDVIYVAIGTPDAYAKFEAYFGRRCMIPVCIWIDDMTRLSRMLAREKTQRVPNPLELCRRFLSDAQNEYSRKNLSKIKGLHFVKNVDLDECTQHIMELCNNITEHTYTFEQMQAFLY